MACPCPSCLRHAHPFLMQGVGRLILSLACAGLGGAPSLELCMAHFSVDLTRLVGALLTASEGVHGPPGLLGISLIAGRSPGQAAIMALTKSIASARNLASTAALQVAHLGRATS